MERGLFYYVGLLSAYAKQAQGGAAYTYQRKGDEMKSWPESRFCYWINPTQDPKKHGGYVPSAVFENEPGHTPMGGDPESHQSAWIWGETLTEARRICAQANTDLGLMEEDVFAIITSSMAASARNRPDRKDLR